VSKTSLHTMPAIHAAPLPPHAAAVALTATAAGALEIEHGASTDQPMPAIGIPLF